MSGKTIAIVMGVALVLLAVSFAGIFGYIKLSTQLQLLFQVVGIAIIVLGMCCKCFEALNRSVDQADRS
jgi:cytochrome c biogenesis protein CcdA